MASGRIIKTDDTVKSGQNETNYSIKHQLLCQVQPPQPEGLSPIYRLRDRHISPKCLSLKRHITAWKAITMT